jgi:hypothetical protein
MLNYETFKKKDRWRLERPPGKSCATFCDYPAQSPVFIGIAAFIVKLSLIFNLAWCKIGNCHLNGKTSLAQSSRNEKGQHPCWPLKIKRCATHLTGFSRGAQAARTDFNPDGPAILEKGRLLQIRFPLALALLLRKADVVAAHRLLAAN